MPFLGDTVTFTVLNWSRTRRGRETTEDNVPDSTQDQGVDDSTSDLISFRDFVADPANHRPRPAAHRNEVATSDPDVPSVINPVTG